MLLRIVPAVPLTAMLPSDPLQVVGLVPLAAVIVGVWLTVTLTVAAGEVQLFTV